MTEDASHAVLGDDLYHLILLFCLLFLMFYVFSCTKV